MHSENCELLGEAGNEGMRREMEAGKFRGEVVK